MKERSHQKWSTVVSAFDNLIILLPDSFPLQSIPLTLEIELPISPCPVLLNSNSDLCRWGSCWQGKLHFGETNVLNNWSCYEDRCSEHPSWGSSLHFGETSASSWWCNEDKWSEHPSSCQDNHLSSQILSLTIKGCVRLCVCVSWDLIISVQWLI